MNDFENEIASLAPADFQSPYDYENEPLLKKLARSLGTGVAQAPNIIGLPGSIAEWAASKTAGKDVNIPYLPTMGSIKKQRQALAQRFLPDKDYLEPNDFMSRAAAYVGGDLPFIAATGVPGLLKSLASGSAMAGVEGLGGGPLLQLGAGTLAGGGVDWIRRGGGVGRKLTPAEIEKGRTGGLFGSDTLSNFGQRTKESAYKSAEEIGKKLTITDKNLEPALDNILTTAKKKMSKAEYKTFYEEVSNFAKDIRKGKIDGESALNARGKFNRMSKEAYDKGNSVLGAYYKDVAKSARNTVDLGRHASKEYGKFVDVGDEMVKVFGNLDKGKVSEMLKDASSLNLKNPLTKLLLLGAGGSVGHMIGKSPVAAGIGIAGGYTMGKLADQIHRATKLAWNSPIIRKHMTEIGKNVAKDQLKQASFNIMKLDKELGKVTGNGQPYTWEEA